MFSILVEIKETIPNVTSDCESVMKYFMKLFKFNKMLIYIMQYDCVNIKASDSLLETLKSATKNATGVAWRLSSYNQCWCH